MDLTLPEELVATLLDPTSKINAVKQVREWTNWDLKAAKDWVEQTPSSPYYKAPTQATLTYPGGETIRLNAAWYSFRVPGVGLEVSNHSLRLIVGYEVVYHAIADEGGWRKT